MTADQPLSENSIPRGGVGGELVVIRYSMLRGTDNFYFFVITFSFKLELVLINRVINIFLTGVPISYAPLHEMNTVLRMFVLGHFCCSQECMQNDRDLIHSADTFF